MSRTWEGKISVSLSDIRMQSEKEIAFLCFLIRITAILCLSMRRDASS
jgi:hypothetical protein